MQYAEIVVHVPISPSWPPPETMGDAPARREWVEQAFTYDVPEALCDVIAPGQMVWVPFGRRQLQGIVVGLSEVSPVAETRSVAEIVHERPLLSPTQLVLARWMAQRYLTPLADCVWLLLPPGIEDKLETFYGGSGEGDDKPLTENQAALLEMIGNSSVKSTQIPEKLRGPADTLVKRGYLTKKARLRPASAHPRQVKTARLCVTPASAQDIISTRVTNTRVRERLARIVGFFGGENQSIWISALYAETGAGSQDLKRLEAAGIVRLEEEEVIRDPLEGVTFQPDTPPVLTNEQAAALARIREGWAAPQPGVYLLHGVTGSGKTEIYLRAIQDVLEQGRQAIALVPEIALTPQTIQRFGARFGERIGIIHSDLSHGERYDTWRRARDGKLDVVIGPRSALFAPLPHLGLIVMDEEHEPSYKQEAETPMRLPAFHAREVALELARLNGAAVILGSATPDIETYWRARGGAYKLIELPRRILAHGAADMPAEYQELPPVEVVDLRAELRAGNTSVFSRALDAEMHAALARRQQVILFLNRRGSATSVLCRDCGEPVRCPRCNNPFTQHEFQGQAKSELLCHHCGKRRQMPRVCPNCGSKRIRGLGLGTEKLDQLVRAQFPGARTLRWDSDTTSGYESYQTILENFKRGESDILIGTQMIAKGLDLPRVTLVGVVNADTGLNLPDFRAGERTFQLLTQVAGRAGRSALGGRVIIQTFNPENYAVRAAANHDYERFYDQEISFRRMAAYPPFRPLVRLILAGPSQSEVQQSAEKLVEHLRDRIRREGLGDVEVIGPAPAFFVKWGGRFRYHLLLRGNDAQPLLAYMPLPPHWRIDVDPMSVL